MITILKDTKLWRKVSINLNIKIHELRLLILNQEELDCEYLFTDVEGDTLGKDLEKTWDCSSIVDKTSNKIYLITIQ